MSVKEKTNLKNIKFEDALANLEKIVQKMESGDFSLDQAIASFEEGTELRKYCEAKLNETEHRVEMIIKNKVKGYSEKIGVKEFDENRTDLSETKGEDTLL